MTTPIALLLPVSGAEPSPQPAPAEDPARFAAALMAALQSAMLPAPVTPAPVNAAAPAPPPAPQTEGQGADAQAGESGANAAAPDAQPEIAATPHGGATMSRGPRVPAQGLTAAEAVNGASSAVESRSGRVLVKDGAQPAAGELLTGGAAVVPLPSASTKNRQEATAGSTSGEGIATMAVATTQTAATPTVPPVTSGRSEVSGGSGAGDHPVEPRGAATTTDATAKKVSRGGMPDTGRVASAIAPVPALSSAPPDELAAGATNLPVAPTDRKREVMAAPVGIAIEDAATVSAEVPRITDSGKRVAERSAPEGALRGTWRNAETRTDEDDAARAHAAASQLATLPATLVMPTPTPMVAPKGEPPASEPRGGEAEASPRGERSEGAQATAVSSGDASAASPIGAAPVAESHRGLAFAQELAALLGDAEITDVRVKLGRGDRGAVRSVQANAPAVEEGASGPVTSAPPTRAPQMPGITQSPAVSIDANHSEGRPPAAQAPAGVPHGSVVQALDDDRAATGKGSIPALSGAVAGAREPAVAPRAEPAPRHATERGDDAGEAPARDSGRAMGEAVRVRIAQPAPQRGAPSALPPDNQPHARSVAASRAPILPASRQEIPPSATRDVESAPVPRREDAREASEPSDAQNRASATVTTLSESLSRGEPRSKELVGGEARNMPDRAETKDRPAGLADRVTLQVADAEGRETRIKVTVLGDQVRAVILPNDQESARHLERRMDDLQAALVRQGFADPKVSVQSPGAASTQAAWGAAPGGTQTDHASGRGTDQPAEDRGQGSGRQDQDRHGDGQRHPQQRFRQRDRDDRQNQDA